MFQLETGNSKLEAALRVGILLTVIVIPIDRNAPTLELCRRILLET